MKKVNKESEGKINKETKEKMKKVKKNDRRPKGAAAANEISNKPPSSLSPPSTDSHAHAPKAGRDKEHFFDGFEGLINLRPDRSGDSDPLEDAAAAHHGADKMAKAEHSNSRYVGSRASPDKGPDTDKQSVNQDSGDDDGDGDGNDGFTSSNHGGRGEKSTRVQGNSRSPSQWSPLSGEAATLKIKKEAIQAAEFDGETGMSSLSRRALEFPPYDARSRPQMLNNPLGTTATVAAAAAAAWMPTKRRRLYIARNERRSTLPPRGSALLGCRSEAEVQAGNRLAKGAGSFLGSVIPAGQDLMRYPYYYPIADIIRQSAYLPADFPPIPPELTISMRALWVPGTGV
jgi:hypothetical protein